MGEEKKSYSENDLAALLGRAYSIESMAGHGKEHLKVELIGTIKEDPILYDVYIDESGGSWYQTRFITAEGEKSDFEKVFGISESLMRKRYRKSNDFY